MIRPVSIALVYGGKRSYKYAKIMEDLILKKCDSLPLIPLLVDGSDRNGGVMDAIINIFEPSNYAFVFISGVYEGLKVDREISDDDPEEDLKSVQMSTPNLMFELGYLYRKMGEKRIKLITDFPYNAISNKFCFPSDLKGNYLCSHPELNDADENMITSILYSILRTEIDNIKNIDGLSEKNDLGYNYTPKIESLFAREKSENINDKSLELQYTVVFKNWQQEIFHFSQLNTSNPRIKENYILIYLYERLLFLPVFHEIGALNINIEDLKISSRLIQTPQLPPEATFFNKIIDYICIHSPISRANFYKTFIDYYSSYGRFTSAFGLSEVIICNYLGLCYLNYAERGSFTDSSDKKEYLENALNCFNRVIKYSNDLFSGTLFEALLCAFANFNKARTQSALGLDLNEFSASFEEAERLRTSLGNRNEFPHFIKMYFKNEMYHCINRQIFSTIKWYEARNERIPKEIINSFKNREIRILNELQRFEETIVAGQSFFQSVKVNANNNLNLLDALSTTSE